jgi:hypothetical protein
MPFTRKISRGRPVPVRDERAEQMRRWHLTARGILRHSMLPKVEDLEEYVSTRGKFKA